jgi:hypothetical protein
MADEKNRDPRAEFLEAVTKWEREFDAQANKFMGTEGYSEWMNQMQQGQLSLQKAYGDFMTQQLHNVNMPTREDVIRNGESLRRVEQRLEAVERLLAELVKAQTGDAAAEGDPNKPKRTKKPTNQDQD